MKGKILIVDDEENIRFALENFLLEKEYEVKTAGNYQEALANIDNAEFDVIFADIILGGKTGSVKDAIITVDKELCVLEANEASKDICNISREVIGMSFDALPKHCNKQCYNAMVETVAKKQSIKMHRIECSNKLRSQ